MARHPGVDDGGRSPDERHLESGGQDPPPGQHPEQRSGRAGAREYLAARRYEVHRLFEAAAGESGCSLPGFRVLERYRPHSPAAVPALDQGDTAPAERALSVVHEQPGVARRHVR